jgi:uncharacterized protein (TIGR02099 family)
MKLYVNWIIKKIWGVLAAFIIVCAVVVQIGRQAAPLVEKHKQKIETYLSSRLNVGVTVNKLLFNWDGLRPELTFSSLIFVNDSGEEILSVDNASAKIDVMSSLFQLEPKVWHLDLQGVNAKLFQSDSQAWYFLKKSSQNISSPISIFLNARDINISNVTIDFFSSTEQKYQLVLSRVSAQNQSGFHRMSGELESSNNAERLNFVIEGEGNLNHWREFSGEAYLSVSDFQFQKTTELFSNWKKPIKIFPESSLNSEIWVNFTPGEVAQFSGHLATAPVLSSQEPTLINSAHTDLWGYWGALTNWQLQLQAMTLVDKKSERAIDVITTKMGKKISVYSPELELQGWSNFVLEKNVLPESIAKIIESLSLTGMAKNVMVGLDLDNPADARVEANVKATTLESWKGIPQVAGLDGYLNIGRSDGYVEIDSQQSFYAKFPNLYDEGFYFEKASGRVVWLIDKEKNYVRAYSDLLSLKGELGDVEGYFSVDSAHQINTRPGQVILSLGLSNAKAQVYQSLIPRQTPESLTQWLDSSIKGGEVAQAGFVYRGETVAGSTNRSIQLGLSIDDSKLKYHPDWPEVSDCDADLVVDNNDIEGQLYQGRFLQSQINTASVSVFENPEGEGPLLHLVGAVVGPAQDGLNFIQQSPLRRSLGKSLVSWALSDDLTTDVLLDVPLMSNQPGLQQQVSVQIDGSKLSIDNLNLTLGSVSGELKYSSSQGLTANSLVADFWGNPVTAVISSQLDGLDSGILVAMKGNVDMTALAHWSARPELLFARGDTTFSTELFVPGYSKQGSAKPISFVARSQLFGVDVELPAPYGKKNNEVKDITFAMTLSPDNTSYKLDYESGLRAHLVSKKNKPLVGEIALQKKLKNNQSKNIWVTGRLNDITGDELLASVKSYQKYSAEIKSSKNKSFLLGQSKASLLKFDIDLIDFSWKDFEFDTIHVAQGQIEGGWSFAFDHDVARGRFGWLDSDEILMVDLESLRLTTSKAGDSSDGFRDDVLQNFDFDSVVSANIKIKKLELNRQDFGSWSFDVEPQPQGLLLNNLIGSVRGINISGKEENAGATLSWASLDGDSRSYFSGELRMQDLGDVLSAWGQPDAVSSKSTYYYADISWPGSPALLDIKALQGEININLNEGRFKKSNDPASSAFLRLMGLFNFDSWVRRLQLDFSDVYKSGMAFDTVRGTLSFEEGMAKIKSPIKVETPSSKFQMGGEIDLINEKIDASLVATLPVGGNITTIAALAAGLPAAAGVYLISKLLDKQIKKLTSVSYKINGSWNKPEITLDRLFDSKAAKKASKKVKDESEDIKI